MRVSPGEVLDIDLRPLDDASRTITFDRVLLVSDPQSDTPPTIGDPYVEGAAITAEVLDEVKGDKTVVFKFKRRKGYRRKTGHRQRYLRIRINDRNAWTAALSS
jgi:large subunit ribosomal protein L21